MKKAILTLLLLDRKSTRLNSSHTVIYTLSLHDALPISKKMCIKIKKSALFCQFAPAKKHKTYEKSNPHLIVIRSEEHTSELQSHSDLHSFPTRRSSDLQKNVHQNKKIGTFLPVCPRQKTQNI